MSSVSSCGVKDDRAHRDRCSRKTGCEHQTRSACAHEGARGNPTPRRDARRADQQAAACHRRIGGVQPGGGHRRRPADVADQRRLPAARSHTAAPRRTEAARAAPRGRPGRTTRLERQHPGDAAPGGHRDQRQHRWRARPHDPASSSFGLDDCPPAATAGRAFVPRGAAPASAGRNWNAHPSTFEPVPGCGTVLAGRAAASRRAGRRDSAPACSIASRSGRHFPHPAECSAGERHGHQAAAAGVAGNSCRPGQSGRRYSHPADPGSRLPRTRFDCSGVAHTTVRAIPADYPG